MPRSPDPTPAQRDLLQQIAKYHKTAEQARAQVVKLVMRAFYDGLPAHRIGEAMGMSEAGARQIRAREAKKKKKRERPNGR